MEMGLQEQQAICKGLRPLRPLEQHYLARKRERPARRVDRSDFSVAGGVKGQPDARAKLTI